MPIIYKLCCPNVYIDCGSCGTFLSTFPTKQGAITLTNTVSALSLSIRLFSVTVSLQMKAYSYMLNKFINSLALTNRRGILSVMSSTSGCDWTISCVST